jgi:hypothetical protein
MSRYELTVNRTSYGIDIAVVFLKVRLLCENSHCRLLRDRIEREMVDDNELNVLVNGPLDLGLRERRDLPFTNWKP